MADGSSSSAGNAAPPGGRFWQGLRDLILGREGEPSLRDQIEEAIDEHEDGDGAGGSQAGDLSPVERQMLRNLLHFGERQVADIAVPRSDIIAFDLGNSFAQLVELFREAGHSRMPAYDDSLDKVVGMVHVKDVYAHLAAPEATTPDPRALVRPTLFVPESMGVLDLLARMRAARTHLAIVIDEFGGTDGLVTIEDLVEEIVGDIEDEHDEAPLGMITSLDGGLFEADARVELDEVGQNIDARLIDEDREVDTLGGLVVQLAGHMPELGEIVRHPSGWRLEVVDGDARRVSRVRLHPPEEVLVEEEV